VKPHLPGTAVATSMNKEDIALLGKVEEREAKQRGLVAFKHSDDESMLNAIEKEKSNACVASAG